MAGAIHVRIFTPQREILDAEVDEMTAEGALGQFGVLPGHITFLTALEPGWLHLRSGTARETLAVKGGYVEVREDVVTVLADEAVLPEDVDRRVAAGALERARRDLEEKPFGHPGHEQARRELRWAELLDGAAQGARS
jgi:F-type H+-transporting ATPase subunit epsilon